MSFSATPPTPPDDAGDSSRRVTWPDVAVLVVVIGFDVFLMSRGLSVQDATITAVSTVAAVLTMLLLPQRFAEAVRLLRAISRSAGTSGPGAI
jgi:hypothetical protein